MTKEYTDKELRSALIQVMSALHTGSIDIRYSDHTTSEQRREIADKLEGAYHLLDDCLTFITVDQGRRKAQKMIKELNNG